MKQTQPFISRSFARGAIFGACVLTALSAFTMISGGSTLFLEAVAPNFFTAALEIGAASLVGMATMGPLFAAVNVITHTVPGLARLVGDSHSGYDPKAQQAVAIQTGKSPRHITLADERTEPSLLASERPKKSYTQELALARAMDDVEGRDQVLGR